jgi:hypothetical protein
MTIDSMGSIWIATASGMERVLGRRGGPDSASPFRGQRLDPAAAAGDKDAVASLPTIPVIDLGTEPLSALAARRPEDLALLLAAGRRHYGRLALGYADLRSQAWLIRAASPLREEIRAVAKLAPGRGAHLLNLAHEWSCTASLSPLPTGSFLLRRTLDWPFDGLGRGLVVARRQTREGPVLEATWPGFVGTLTALAPGRFAVAFNQAPRRRHLLGRAGAWIANRRSINRSRALPPAHLLREVVEDAPDFGTALAMLCQRPLCVGGLFTLAGPGPEDAAVVERDPKRYTVHRGAAAVANHWPSRPQWGVARGRDSHARAAALGGSRPGALPFDWVVPPVLNADTRLAFEADPASGYLALQGYERDGVATAPLELGQRPAAASLVQPAP